MKRMAKLLPMLGASLCFAVIPAAAQGGRGMGKAGGATQGQASRPTPGPPAEQGSSKGREGQATSQNPERTPSMAASQALQKNPQLSSRLQTLLPPGTIPTDAAAGFKNSGQFIAAVHVSHNLGIPFEDLKKQMLAGDSLGKAIRTLKPDLPNSEVNKEVKKAEDEAKDDMKATAQQQEEKTATGRANTTTP
jgi:hypothetical protein